MSAIFSAFGILFFGLSAGLFVYLLGMVLYRFVKGDLDVK